MKKVLIILVVVLVIAFLGILYFLRSSSGYRSIYFVPENASIVVESKDPIGAWSTIVHSYAWKHYQTNSFFSGINEDIQSYDSIVNSSKVLLKLMGKKSAMISMHPLGNNQYDFLYIIDIGKLAQYKKPEKVLNSVLGKGYEVTSRDFKDHKIIELFDTEDGDYYFLSLANGKLIFSLNPKLVEQSIEAAEKMTIGRDIKYLDVKSKIGNKGLFSIYIVHDNFNKFMTSLSPEVKENLEKYTHDLRYTGFYFDFNEEGLLTIEGYSSFGDEHEMNYLSAFDEGKQELFSARVIPQRIASLLKINFDDASSFFKTSMKQMGEHAYSEYEDNLKSTEKKLKINFDKNLFSWMDKEIVMLQTQPSNLGRDNEFALILHAKDSLKAINNLNIIWRQIKKNTPVKIKSVNYKGFEIDYVAFPGILKLLFGKALGKIEKPYFTVINDNVVVSNHPQTLKNIIDDYTTGNTLEGSLDFYNFGINFEKSTSAFLYFEPPVLYQNMKAFLSYDTWNKLKQNKKYITCFSQAGIQLSETDDMFRFRLKAKYQPELEEWKKQFYSTGEIMSLFNYAEPVPIEETESETKKDTVPKIFISDLDAREYKEYYDNGNLKLSVEVKDGLKDGDFRYYHENGEIYIRGSFDNDQPNGKWKYYDESGELIKTDKY